MPNVNHASVTVMRVLLDVAAVAANTSAEQVFTVPGLQPGDFVYVNKPDLHVGLGIVNARVTSADTLGIQFMNITAGAIDPGANAPYQVLIVRPI